MKEMQSEQTETKKINEIVCRNFKKPVGYGIKIFRISLHKSEPHEIKIEEMKDNESQHRGACPNHEF